MKKDKGRREYQESLGELYVVQTMKRLWTEGDVQLVWKEMKECIVGTARNLYGVVKGRIGSEKHTRWLNDEVKVAVRQ